jgi:hypothetical protein
MESNGDPSALSPADARGLMQVLHGPWDPRVNVFTGVHMLARFLQEFGSLSLALAAYNAGPNAVEAYGGIPPYRETRDYVIVVSYLYDLYGHRPLSSRRKQQYRNTLLDLKRFADQRKKVKQLARAGHVDDAVALLCSAYGEGCDTRKITVLFPTLDPFWPLAGPPDPLQRVSWPTRTNSAAGGKR